SAYVPLGWNVGATPDGRYAGEPLADTIAPINGVDIKGPTATHKSAAKLDTLRITDGVIFNHRFSLGAVSTEADLYKWAALLRTYFDMGGLEVSYMVSNKDTLLDAQKNPEKYPGLIVRVAGYSAFFVELSKEVQDTIINRTEHTW
ncbi:MAG: glycyl radical protein, partial [Candidatus Aenigmarchaeota archaeon]|nr:glycyl radical protein [Candidatus Aenigmarchaeota archaeon]